MGSAAIQNEPHQAKWIQYTRTAINFPPLVFVSGLVILWLFLIFFGQSIGVHVLKGKPHLPFLVELSGYIFLLGTLLNFILYPVVWGFLSIFKRALFPGAAYAVAVWAGSIIAFAALWRWIYWFLD